jgi:hypothetical protein
MAANACGASFETPRKRAAPQDEDLLFSVIPGRASWREPGIQNSARN